MATNSRPRKRSKIWRYFTEQSDRTAKCNFCHKLMSFKGGNSCNLIRHLRRVHPTVSLSFERLTPAHSSVDNKTSDANPDDPEIPQPVSSNEEASNDILLFPVVALNINKFMVRQCTQLFSLYYWYIMFTIICSYISLKHIRCIKYIYLYRFRALIGPSSGAT
jgi:hypothetical protein